MDKDLTKLRQQLHTQVKEKEEWMQKFYTQMTENEVKDRMLNKTLGILEGEVQRLSSKANELRTENANLREEGDVQRLEIETLRSKVKQATEAVTQERWTYAKELEEFGKQLANIKAKLQQSPKSTDLKSPRKASTRLTSDYMQQIADMRSQLNSLSSSLLSPKIGSKTSPHRGHLSPRRKAPEKVRPSSTSVTSPRLIQSEIEEMITRIETRLQKARQLTNPQD